jgi:hypothetical protein
MIRDCPSCAASLPVSAISEGLRAARCPSCRTLIDLDSSRAVQQPRALAVAVPEKWKVESAPGSLKVSWRWFSAAVFFLVPFTLFWNGIMVSMTFGMTDGFAHPERLLIALVVPHVWVGVGLTYYCLTLFLNSTTVEFHEGSLRVQHGPLFWRGNRKLGPGEVQQLFVVEKRGSKGSVSFELCGLLRDGKRLKLISGLSDEASARFLEVKLEQAMNIVDQAVAGEVRR